VLVKKDSFLLGFSVDENAIDWYDPENKLYLKTPPTMNTKVNIKDGVSLNPKYGNFNNLSITTLKTKYTFDLYKLSEPISKRVKESMVNDMKYADCPFLQKPLHIYDSIKQIEYTILKYGLEQEVSPITATSTLLSSLSTFPSSWNPNLMAKIGGGAALVIVFAFLYYLIKKA
jgi:hypothetical protein